MLAVAVALSSSDDNDYAMYIRFVDDVMFYIMYVPNADTGLDSPTAT